MSTVNYQIHSDSEHKPWLMLVHGLFGNLDNMSALRRQLTESYQVLCIDLPDHGKSAFTQSFSFNNYATVIAQLLEELAINQLTLVGHSLGGKVAMQLALNQPELISHLVVLDIAPVAYSARHSKVFEGLNTINLAELTSRKEADTALAQHVEDKATRQFLLKSLYNDDDIWQWRFNLALLEKDYPKISSAITLESKFTGPVLFIKGGLSDYLLAEHRPAVLELFPNSQSKVIQGVGHWLHAEKPDICAKLILDFLN